MSLVLTEEHRLSVRPFAAVPALLDLPEIKRGPASVSFFFFFSDYDGCIAQRVTSRGTEGN